MGSMHFGMALAIGMSIVAGGCGDEGALSPEGMQTASERPNASAAPRRMSSLKVGERAPGSSGPQADAGGDARPAVDGSLPPTVNGANPKRDPAPAITPTTNGSSNRQSIVTRATTGTSRQRQDGSGNTQLLNVEGTSSAGVAQRQGGAGNFQSMNVGVTDNPSIPNPGAGSKP